MQGLHYIRLHNKKRPLKDPVKTVSSAVRSRDTQKQRVFFHFIFHLFIQGLLFKMGKTTQQSPRTRHSTFIKQHLLPQCA